MLCIALASPLRGTRGGVVGMGKGMLLARMVTFWKAGNKSLGLTGRQGIDSEPSDWEGPPLPSQLMHSQTR